MPASPQCKQCGIDLPPSTASDICPACSAQDGLPGAEPAHLNLRCPHCRNAVEVLHDSPLSDVTCESCGTNFSLVHDPTVTYQTKQARSIGHFDLLDALGTGAFGTVWKAKDNQLDRLVAIKIPRQGQLSPDDAEAFLREARAAAQLNHPNIVSVHEVGREDGTIYVVSDFVEGISLADWITGHRPTSRESAELCLSIVRALEHAHQIGVIHRDMKPHNVMLDLDYEPHIMDFGLAKREAAEITMTAEGKVLGTPAYMSPEQAKGEAHQADARTDIYSIGVILFELLTGERPFRGNSRMLIHQVIHEEAPTPRKLNGQVPLDLDTICRKCLEKDPRQRYQSAGELAAELQRFLEGKPILARPISGPARGWRWCKRNPVFATLSATVAALWLVLAIGGPIAAINQTRLATEATSARDDAEDKGRQLQHQLRTETAIRLAGQSHSIRDELPVQSLLLATAAVETTRRYDQSLVPIAHETLLNMVARVGGHPLMGHQGRLSCLAISPDGHWLVTGGTTDKTLRLWDLTARDPATASHALHGHTTGIWCVAFSADSSLLATGSSRIVRLWDLSGPIPPAASLVLGGHEGFVTDVAFSPDGHWLASGSTDRVEKIGDDQYKRHPPAARLWDLRAAQPGSAPVLLYGHNKRISTVAFSPDSRWLATGSWDDTARLWDLAAEDPANSSRALLGHERDQRPLAYIRSLSFSPDGRWLVTGSDDTTARLWDVRADDPSAGSRVLSGHEGNVYASAFSPDGRWLVTGSDRNARIWDMQREAPDPTAVVLRGHTGGIHSLAISPDGRRLATGSADKTVRLWELDADDPAASSIVLRGHEGSVSGVALTPDGAWLASGSSDGTARLWDLRRPDPSSELSFRGHRYWAGFSSDPRWLVTADKTVRLWDLNTDPLTAVPRELVGHQGTVYRSATSPNGRWLATVSSDKMVHLWDLAAANPSTANPSTANPSTAVRILQGFQGTPGAVAFSWDHRWLAVGSSDQTTRLWDLAATSYSVPALQLKGEESSSSLVVFSRDNRWLVTGSLAKKYIRIWDLTAADPTASSHTTSDWGHSRSIRSVAFSPDSRWLVTGGSDNSARLWTLNEGRPVSKHLLKHEGSVQQITFTADGRWLLTGGHDSLARVWDLSADDPAAAVLVLKGHEGPLDSATISLDGRWVATASRDKTARLWDLNADDPVHSARVLRAHEQFVMGVEISSDGRWLLTNGMPGRARLWDLDPESLIRRALRLAGRRLTAEERQKYLVPESSAVD